MQRFHAPHWDRTYWPRWLYGRIDPSLDTALHDWTELIDHALNEGLGDAELRSQGLWAPYQRPRVCWHPDRRPNAFADLRRNGVPVIAVTLGAYHRIQDFAYRFFTTADLGEGIGDASCEQEPLHVRARNRAWIADPGDPSCPIRREACYLTAECCVPLLFYHEAGHLALDHFRSKRRAKFRERVRLQRQLPSDKRVEVLAVARAMQFEELQADRFALAIATNHWRSSKRAFPRQRITATLEPYLNRLLLIALVAIHIAFAPDLDEVADYDGLEHPHPLTRLVDAVGSATRAKLLQEPADHAVIGDAFRLASLMGDKPLSATRFAIMARDAQSQHLAILESVRAPSV